MVSVPHSLAGKLEQMYELRAAQRYLHLVGMVLSLILKYRSGRTRMTQLYISTSAPVPLASRLQLFFDSASHEITTCFHFSFASCDAPKPLLPLFLEDFYGEMRSKFLCRTACGNRKISMRGFRRCFLGDRRSEISLLLRRGTEQPSRKRAHG